MGRRNGSGAVGLALLALACGQTSRVNDAAAGGAGKELAGEGGTSAGATRGAGGGGSTNAPGMPGSNTAAGAGAFAGMTSLAAAGASGAATGANGGAPAAVAGASGAVAGAAGSASGGTGGSGGACPVWPIKAAPAPAEVTFNGVSIKSSEHDCAWRLSNSVKLPLTTTHTRMLFHYDVNGDGIDDVYVGPNLDDPNPPAPPNPRTITLLLSKLDGSALSYESTGCELAPPLVDGTYALRDLDGDGVNDFVIAVNNGFRVVMNRPTGPELTITYDFPAITRPQLSLRDVVLGAFEQSPTSELAVGFMRIDNFASTHSGVLLFPDPAHASAQAPVSLVSSNQQGNGFDVSLNPQLAIFTALPGGRALFGASTHDTWVYQKGKLATTAGGLQLGIGDAPYVSGATYLDLISVGGHDRVFACVGDKAYGFDPQDPKQHLTIPLAFAEYTACRLVDVDGDGDLDLVDTQLANTPSIGVHNGDQANGPATQSHQFTPDRYRAPSSDTPFLAVGALKGRLLVSDADRGDVRGFPLTVSALVCGP